MSGARAKTPSARTVALAILKRVLVRRQSLNSAIPAEIEALEAAQERALARELAFGVMRDYYRLDFFLQRLLAKPLKAKDADVRCALLLGLYQLNSLRLPAYAAVSATVDLAQVLRKPWARGLINGVLRQFQRQGPELVQAAEAEPQAATAHPQWLLRRLREAWPEHWQAIIAANNQRPPMVLRVNRRRQPRAAYLARLAEAGLEGQALAASEDGVVLTQACDVSRLPGFAQGAVSVQDGAAQQAAILLAAEPGQRVLDACAAPGGKSAHILERCPEVALVAVERDPARLQQVSDTLARLGLRAELHAADVAATADWWDGRPFERILLDVPCSATGVIRRNPDIKYLRRDGDITTLAREQGRILEAVWPLLAPGGRLLYATCSILPEENQDQVRAFLAAHPEARERPLAVDWGRPCAAGRQILPGEQGMDGFYYAMLEKRG